MATRATKPTEKKTEDKKTTTPKVVAKKPVETTAAKAPVKKTTTSANLEVNALDLSGKAAGTVSLDAAIFGAKVNKDLLSQALRVYNNNRLTHWGHTKTRGEVVGSTRKLFRQKGTGNARRGSILSPISVGGGIALGPRARKVELDLPKKMRLAALVSALSQKQVDGQVVGLAAMAKASGKTKDMAVLVKKMDKKSVLIVDHEENPMVRRMVRNLGKVDYMPASQINVFEVISHQSIALSKEAVEALEKRVKGESK